MSNDRYERIREAFDEISGLCRHLRQGGPAPEDLQDLSDALDEAVGIAANMLRALAQQPAAPSGDVNVAGMPEFDGLLDHIYEYGTASEGVIEKANAFARAVIARYAPQQPAAVDGRHCGTCTCNPNMTPAVRFDLSPAQMEGAIREHLIRLGWTPPKRRRYDPSGSLSEYGIFPECDAQPLDTATPPSEAVVEAVARAICVSCEDDPDSPCAARGNEFRWQDYRDVALAAISAFATQHQEDRND